MFQGHSAGCKFCLGILVVGETYCVTLFVGSLTNTGKQWWSLLCISCFKMYFLVSKTLQFVGVTSHLIIPLTFIVLLRTLHLIFTIHCVHI